MNKTISPPITLEGEYRCLSTLHPVWVNVGMNWPSPEHALAAARLGAVGEERERLLKELWKTPTPEQARRLSKRWPVRKDWPQVRDQHLEEIMRLALKHHPMLAQKLKDTGDRLLLNVEDTEFGCEIDEFTGEIKGKNRLGNLLMRLRNELQNENH